jgi:ATP-dependent protease ClpP protease subunit
MPSIAIEGLISWATVARFRAVSAACAEHDYLVVEVDSNGGDVPPALALADAIRAHRGTTYGQVDRQAHSAAALCFAACTVRSAAPSALFQLHETACPSVRGRLTATVLRQSATQLDHDDDECRKRIAAWTGMDADLLADLERQERRLTAREALEIGLVTVLTGCPALTAAARQRRAAKAARARLTVPGAASAKFTGAEIMAMATLLGERPLGIAPVALRAMLQARRP